MIAGAYSRCLKVTKSELLLLIRNEVLEGFNDHYFNDKKVDRANVRVGNDTKNAEEEEPNEDGIEVIEDYMPNALIGNMPLVATFSIINHFKMPSDDDQCANNLLVELLNNKEHKNECFTIYKHDKEIKHR